MTYPLVRREPKRYQARVGHGPVVELDRAELANTARAGVHPADDSAGTGNVGLLHQHGDRITGVDYPSGAQLPAYTPAQHGDDIRAQTVDPVETPLARIGRTGSGYQVACAPPGAAAIVWTQLTDSPSRCWRTAQHWVLTAVNPSPRSR